MDAPQFALAQAWPSRPIRRVVPFPPGLIDNMTRLIGPQVAQAMQRQGADVGFLDSRLMGAFMAADGAKWKREAAATRTSPSIEAARGKHKL